MKICSFCQREFVNKSGRRAKYCSEACAHQGRIKDKTLRLCPWCQGEIPLSRGGRRRGKYCSATCYHAHVKSGVSGANGWKPTAEQKAHIGAGIRQAFTDPEKRVNRARLSKSQWAEMPEKERKRRTLRLALSGAQHQQLHTRVSPLEIAICNVLDALGIEYRRQEPIANLLVDIYIPSQNLVVECQGCFWHGCKQCGYDGQLQQSKRYSDEKRKAIITGLGYRFIEIWEHDIRTDPSQAFKNAVRAQEGESPRWQQW